MREEIYRDRIRSLEKGKKSRLRVQQKLQEEEKDMDLKLPVQLKQNSDKLERVDYLRTIREREKVHRVH